MEIKVKSIFFDLFGHFSPKSDGFLVNRSCVLVFWMVPLRIERGFLQVLVQKPWPRQANFKENPGTKRWREERSHVLSHCQTQQHNHKECRLQ